MEAKKQTSDDPPTQSEAPAEPDSDSAPLFVLREVTAESGIAVLDRAGTTTPSQNLSDDIVSKGLISHEDALFLLSIFQQHYGRWVSFDPLVRTAVLLGDVRKSPLLLAACCLIAVRHTSQELAARLAPTLLRESKSHLSLALLVTPQYLEFFQAVLVLSMWSTTIGRVPLSMDSWLLSSFALQHSIASGIWSSNHNHSSQKPGRSGLDTLCVWNHLCLVHLHYCVGTRRKAVLDRKDVEQCRRILDAQQTSNFESRMVAEVFLYWIIYESSLNPVDVPRTQSALQTWREEWNFLFDQPRSQFIQMGYCFAQLLTYDRSLKTKSAAVRETLLLEMVHLSTTIIRLAMNTTDERTKHLTDHIYHMLSFAAVTLTRLLHSYEEQLAASHDLQQLDELILSLATWLHAIGLPCHIAYTMGNVVAAVHKKLRPDAGPSPSDSYTGVDPAIHDEFAQFFPELFGNSPMDTMHVPMLPDFQLIP